MGNKYTVRDSDNVKARQDGHSNNINVNSSNNIEIEQKNSNSNDNIILIIAIGIIAGSFFFLFQEKGISKELLQVLYMFVSLAVGIVGNFLIGTINITYKEDKGILKASGSIALIIITFLSLQYGLK